MPSVNGLAAIAWMRAKRTNVPGSCLNTCWQAYGSFSSIGPHAGQYPNAINGWQYATRRHPGDWNPPAGVPVYFDALTRPRYAGDTNYAAGDVVISVGGGRVICTDGAGAGLIAEMTIARRASQIGRTYLGWCEDFLGYDVAYAGASAATAAGSSPLTEAHQEEHIEEIDMPNGYYAKGDQMAPVYWIDQTTGLRRAATAGEIAAAQQFNQATGGKFGAGAIATIQQAQLDAIKKVPGSVDWDGHVVGPDGK